jgi:hypothetical protein
MTILSTLKLVEFKPQYGGGRLQGRRQKLAEKIDQQIQLADDPTYRPMKLIWFKDASGAEHHKEVPKKVRRWWVQNLDGSVQLTIRYGNKSLELAKGKTAVEIGKASEISSTLAKIREAVINGEMDSVLSGNFGPNTLRKTQSATK